MAELMDNALKSKHNQEWGPSNCALELLGKELGMFDLSDEALPWDEDLSKPIDQQLAQLMRYVRKIPFRDDVAALETAERKALGLLSADIIEVTADPQRAPTLEEAELR